MLRDSFVRNFRADLDTMVESMNRLRARKKEYTALDCATALVDADCGTATAQQIKDAVGTWDEIETLLTNPKFATLIRARQ